MVVPWHKLSSLPVTLDLQDVYMLATPLNEHAWRPEEEETRSRSRQSRGSHALSGGAFAAGWRVRPMEGKANRFVYTAPDGAEHTSQTSARAAKNTAPAAA